MQITREALAELTEVLEDTVEYYCDQQTVSGELAWTVVESLATAKTRAAQRRSLLMACRVNNIYQVLDTLKADVIDVCKSEGISLDLFWILVRQQADYELKIIAEKLKDK